MNDLTGRGLGLLPRAMPHIGSVQKYRPICNEDCEVKSVPSAEEAPLHDLTHAYAPAYLRHFFSFANATTSGSPRKENTSNEAIADLSITSALFVKFGTSQIRVESQRKMPI